MNDKKLAQVFHYDLYGKREEKYEFLTNQKLISFKWDEIKPSGINYIFKEELLTIKTEYDLGFSIANVFLKYSSGIETRKDNLVISFEENVLNQIIKDFISHTSERLQILYKVDNLSRDWKVEQAISDIKHNNPQIVSYAYKPMDIRKIIYTGKTKGVIGYPMFENFKHVYKKENIGIIAKRGRLLGSDNLFTHVFVAKNLVDKNFLADLSYFFPLYTYSSQILQTKEIEKIDRIPNFNPQIVQQLAGQLALTFTPEKEPTPGTFAPIDILDYIYAILHSPTYRAKYKEFLKIDFPRIPYPKDQETFWRFVKLGGELRQIHLLESPVVERFITSYPVSGTNEVGKVKYEEEKVWINESQYFDHVPQVAWEFYIGGYQPAQKWLKDRKGRQLSFEDVRHYQKIIVALTKTDRIMKEIDKVEFE